MTPMCSVARYKSCLEFRNQLAIWCQVAARERCWKLQCAMSRSGTCSLKVSTDCQSVEPIKAQVPEHIVPSSSHGPGSCSGVKVGQQQSGGKQSRAAPDAASNLGVGGSSSSGGSGGRLSKPAGMLPLSHAALGPLRRLDDPNVNKAYTRASSRVHHSSMASLEAGHA